MSHRRRFLSVVEVEPEFLASVPIFNRCLEDNDLADLAKGMQPVTFNAGDTFIKEGDDAKEFFVIVSGIAGVFQLADDGKEVLRVATLQDGDVFGESALITDGKRNASLTAETQLVCFCISADKVKAMGLQDKLQFTKRHAIGREGCLDKAHSFGTLCSSVSTMSVNSDDMRLVTKAFLDNPNLKHLVPTHDCNFAKDVVQSCRRLEAEKGQVIVSQGEIDADHFYIIEKGSVSVDTSPNKSSRQTAVASAMRRMNSSLKRLATLKSGQSFGELALLYKAPRQATVTALESTAVLCLDRQAFKDILKKATMSKSADHIKYFDGLEMLSYLSPAEKRLAATALESVHFMSGSVVYEVEDPATTLYILIDGKVEMKHQHKGKKTTLEANFGKKGWKYFGQAALISTGRRDATVTVVSPNARALMLDRDAFSMSLGGSTLAPAASTADNWLKRIGIVQQLRVLSGCPDDVKEALARQFKKATYEKGDLLYTKGDAPTHCYILVNGCVEMLDGRSCVPLEGLMHFGDREMFEGKQRRCTVKVASEAANVLRLETDIFLQLMTPFKDKFVAFWPGAEQQILKKDLIMEGLITKTPLGAVELCRHSVTGTTYVLKTLRKDLIVEQGLQQSVMRERAAWVQLKCSFIVQLTALYNEPRSLHFLSEYAPFGSLAALFHKECLYSSEKHVKFYLGGVVIALRHVHKRHLLHRDVKPENILVSKSGHPKLYDFALSKPLIAKTFTVCGTPEYMAPEVLAGAHQTRALDWWSVGVMVFELMTGTSPFRAKDPLAVYAKIMEGLGGAEFPDSCGGKVVDLVKRLCKQDPEARLSPAPRVMAHNWFAGFNWQEMASQRMEPPYRPTEDERENIDKRGSPVHNHDLPTNLKYKDDGTGWDLGFASNVGLLGGASGSVSLEDLSHLTHLQLQHGHA